MSSRVLLIGGTSDSRLIARALTAAGLDVLVSTATEYGAELAASEAASHAGTLDAAGMADLGAGCAAIVDASHPFARLASEAAREAARIIGVPYVRYERPGVSLAGDYLACATAEEAARAAVEIAGAGGTILLTIGSRTLATYVAICREADVRCVARVLPVAEALEACVEAGLAPSDIIAMQGPTSAELDAALLLHFGASVLVTKNSGWAGGVSAKLEAAQRVGAAVVVVDQPERSDEDALHSVSDVVAAVLALPGITALQGVEPERTTEQNTSPVLAEPAAGLVHLYTGDGKGKTTAAVGLAARASGAGLRVAFVQLAKGGRPSSELASLHRLGVEVVRPATLSSGLMRNITTQQDLDAAATALATARTFMAGAFDVVILDEACVAARRGLIALSDLIDAIQSRAPHVEVVVTGRDAPEELFNLADYITEFIATRHPYERGIRAREGIEY